MRTIEKITSNIGHSGCTVCDRNEAAYQTLRINARIAQWRARIDNLA